MGSRDHESIILRGERGLWYRNTTPQISAPEDFLSEALNFAWGEGFWATRNAFNSLVGTTAQVIRFYRFARSTGSARYIWLDSAGNLYDTGSATPSTPIITAATAGWGTPTDFSMVSMYDRAYITPHNQITGLSGAFLWVYNPDWTAGVRARKAALTRPGAWGGGSATAAGGNCEPGVHLVAVAYETTSGFISKISATVLQFTCTAANRQINLTNVPTGTANVVTKRHILMTKVIPNFNGDVFSSEWFFVDTINDNVTTTYNISKYDTELVKSMDYLEDMLEEIPAGIALAEYKGCLCVAGENANSSIIRVSVPGDPESMAATDGFVNCAAFDGRGVRNLISDGETIRWFKSARSGLTVSNGGAPNTWPVKVTDGDQGCEFAGIGRMFESGGIDAGQFVVANTNGLYLFDGTLNNIPLSWNIDTLWKAHSTSSVLPIQVVMDGTSKKIYCCVGLTYIFVCDYTQGLSPETVRWYRWNFLTSGGGVNSVNCIQAHPGGLLVSTAAYNGISTYGVFAANDHWGGVVQQSVSFPAVPKNTQGVIHHYGQVRLAVLAAGGTGNYTVSFTNSLDAKQGSPSILFLTTPMAGTAAVHSGLMNSNSGMLGVTIESDSAVANLSISLEYIALYYKPIALTGVAM